MCVRWAASFLEQGTDERTECLMNATGISPKKRITLQGLGVYTLLFVMLLVAAYMLFVHLDTAPIPDYDGAIHGISAYEMIRNNDYLVHTDRGLVDYWNLKPPLSMWCIALCYKLFGFSVFAFRLYAPVSMLLLMAVLTFWTKRRHGSIAALAVLALMLATQTIYQYHFGRDGDPDAQFQLLFTIAMLCMLDSPRNFRMLYGSAFCFGLAFMSKSWHAAFIPVICFLFVIFTRQLQQLSWKRCLLLIATGLLPILPWAVARYSRDGFAFFSAMVSRDIVERSTSSLESSGEPFWYYFEYFAKNPIIIACVLISLLCWLLCRLNGKRLRGSTRQVVLGCILWAVVPAIVYSFAVTKHMWYVFGALFAMALMTAVLIREAVQNGRPNVLKIGVLGLGLAFCVYQTAANMAYVSNLAPNNQYTIMLKENLDREYDSGMHAYIQYNEDWNGWNFSDRLVAMLYGDVVCLAGGVPAYAEDGEAGLLLIGKQRVDEITEISEYSYYRDESYYVALFEK